nr:ATP-binding protein [uncultured Sulfurimonas sp.]
MNDFLKKTFKESMIGPIVIITSVMLLGLFYLVPTLSKEQDKKDAFYEAQRFANYIRTFRAYYTDDILTKVKANTDLKINFDHKGHDDTIPLPATVVHDLAELFTSKADMSVLVYSDFPFPNRNKRVLDDFQKESLRYILANPDKAYSREDTIKGKHVYRTAFADFLSKEACVSCHNNHPDTPKTTWNLGDVRGVIEVTLPLSTSENSINTLTKYIILFILLNFMILTIYYMFITYFKNKKLQNKNIDLQEKYSHKDKILSEYKRAVDMGAIVSKADKRGKITYVNDAFTKISGYSKEELLGKPHSIVRHPDTPKEVFKEMWEKILNKQVWQGDIKNRAKDARDYYVFATIVPILDEKENIVEFLAIRYDTTNLHLALKEATKAEKSKGRFLANMSHELRTPLNAIIGFSQILQRRKTLEDKDRDYVEKINISGQNLLSLVNSILDFSKMDENEMIAHPTDVNIKALFEEVLIMLETDIDKKDITVNMFEIDKDENIYADRQLLKQALINLLSNAVKFSKQNGRIEITHKKENSKNVFGICDNGEGISKEEIETLFTPFKQGENAHNNAAKGTGLGLAITKKIITELHDGNIWVESELGKGACFYISLRF